MVQCINDNWGCLSNRHGSPREGAEALMRKSGQLREPRL